MNKVPIVDIVFIIILFENLYVTRRFPRTQVTLLNHSSENMQIKCLIFFSSSTNIYKRPFQKIAKFYSLDLSISSINQVNSVLL